MYSFSHVCQHDHHIILLCSLMVWASLSSHLIHSSRSAWTKGPLCHMFFRFFFSPSAYSFNPVPKNHIFQCSIISFPQKRQTWVYRTYTFVMHKIGSSSSFSLLQQCSGPSPGGFLCCPHCCQVLMVLHTSQGQLLLEGLWNFLEFIRPRNINRILSINVYYYCYTLNLNKCKAYMEEHR